MPDSTGQTQAHLLPTNGSGWYSCSGQSLLTSSTFLFKWKATRNTVHHVPLNAPWHYSHGGILGQFPDILSGTNHDVVNISSRNPLSIFIPFAIHVPNKIRIRYEWTKYTLEVMPSIAFIQSIYCSRTAVLPFPGNICQPYRAMGSWSAVDISLGL